MSTTAIHSTSDSTVVSAASSVQTELALLTARLRRDVWLYGLLAFVATAVVILLATIVFDATLQPELTGLRFALWIPVLAAGAIVIFRFVWYPLRERCNALALAWSLEEQRPGLQEGLTSTLLLAESEHPGAASLIDAVAEQACRNLAGCRDDDAIRRDFRRPGLAAASSLAIAALCFAVWPQYLIPSLSNVMAPWKTRQLPYLKAVITPGHIAVGEGESVAVSALGSDLFGSVLEITDNGSVVSSMPMTATVAGDQANGLLLGLTTDQTYRIRSGSFVSNDYQITVHPRPAVIQAKATLQFPEYSGIQPVTIDDLSGAIVAIPGTKVRLSVATLIPLSDASLTLGDKLAASKSVQADGFWWHHWNLQVDERPVQAGSLHLISEHGVSNTPFSFEIQGVPDQSPTVSIRTPTLHHVAVQPDGRLPIQVEAIDDFGLHSVEVLIQTAGADPVQRAVLQDLVAVKYQEEFIFDPRLYDLEVGDQLELWFVATDHRTQEFGGPQAAESQRLVITIGSNALSVGAQQVIDEEIRILEALTDAMDRLNEARETAEQISEASLQAIAGSKDGVPGIPADINTDAQKLQRQLQETHRALEEATDSNEGDTALFEAELQQVRDIADGEVEEARYQARMIPLTSDPKHQQHAADAARSAIQRAEEKLAAVKERLENRAEKLKQAAELDDLTRQQNELARRMEEREQPQQHSNPKQEQIADRLQQLVDDDPEAASEQFLQRAESAEQLADRTTQIQEQQQQLINANEKKSGKETRKQLARMIRTEQEALAAENQKLTKEERRDPAKSAKEDAAAEAQKLMEQVTHDLAEQNLKAAEQDAENAKEKLQDAAGVKEAPDDGQSDQQQQAKSEERDRLAKRQGRIEEAIRAVKGDDFEAAKNELQELITDRLEQVTREAEELLELPTDDEENRQARDEAKQELRAALNDSRQALAKPEDQKPANASKSGAHQQPGQPAEQNGQPAQQDQEPGEPQAPQQGDPKQDQTAKQSKPGQKNALSKQQLEAGQNQAEKPADQKQQPGQNKEKKREPRDEPANNNQPQDRRKPQQEMEKQGQQQNKAAQSLEQASESLQQFCKSCQKCANCNKSGKSGSSSGNSSKSGNTKFGNSPSGEKRTSNKDADGKRAGAKQSNEKQAGGDQPGQSDENESGLSKQLAKAADNAQKAARNPTLSAAKQLARELNKLADNAAQNSNSPNRKGSTGESGRENDGTKQDQKTDGSKTGGPEGNKSPSGVPMGVGRDSQPDDVDTIATQLRGPSSSEWTRSHKRLQGNVLDSKSPQIPEAYRGVVEDYFEQLSRIESDDKQAEASK